jgi:hypothetical protein
MKKGAEYFSTEWNKMKKPWQIMQVQLSTEKMAEAAGRINIARTTLRGIQAEIPLLLLHFYSPKSGQREKMGT